MHSLSLIELVLYLVLRHFPTESIAYPLRAESSVMKEKVLVSQTPSMESAQRYTTEPVGTTEEAWQDCWDEWGTFSMDNPMGELVGPFAQEEPFFLLDMLLHSSSEGLYVGHSLGYIVTDIVARLRRTKDGNVLYTVGHNAFGLSAEQYTVQTGQYPRVTIEENVVSMCR